MAQNAVNGEQVQNHLLIALPFTVQFSPTAMSHIETHQRTTSN
jgi:hypothetical protein